MHFFQRLLGGADLTQNHVYTFVVIVPPFKGLHSWAQNSFVSPAGPKQPQHLNRLNKVKINWIKINFNIAVLILEKPYVSFIATNESCSVMNYSRNSSNCAVAEVKKNQHLNLIDFKWYAKLHIEIALYSQVGLVTKTKISSH